MTFNVTIIKLTFNLTKGSRMAETILSQKIVKPQQLCEKITFTKIGKKRFKIWEAFTSLTIEKRAVTIFMTLTGEVKEAVLNMKISEFTDENGVKNLASVLDQMYVKDESASPIKFLQNLWDHII